MQVGIIILSAGGLSTNKRGLTVIILLVPGLPAPDDHEMVAGEAVRIVRRAMAACP